MFKRYLKATKTKDLSRLNTTMKRKTKISQNLHQPIPTPKVSGNLLTCFDIELLLQPAAPGAESERPSNGSAGSQVDKG